MLSVKDLRQQIGTIELRLPRLTLNPGKIVLLLGESGCGKTSLLKILAGYMDPQRGRIQRQDMNGVAFLMQNPRYQILKTRVADELAFPLDNYGITGLLREQLLQTIPQQFGLQGLLSRDPRILSLGELQMLMLAATFIANRDLIILDEPTSHLGMRDIDRLESVLRREADKGRHLLISSQYSDDLRLCDTLWIMDKGGIYEYPVSPQDAYRDRLVSCGLLEGDQPC